ncbi:FAD-dependent oxidoreductase [Streptomyces achromogenes]|uniref:FAD-dependent oxidoreductase n=1 Tax=Streptomyces achromogenes TaxID=67255 RepID=UPI00358E01FA
MSVDVAIFGAGRTGPSAARHLARKSADVHGVVTGTVGLRHLWAQRRHGHPGHVDRLPGNDLPLRLRHSEGMPAGAHDAVDALQRLVKEENVDCGFARTGELNLAPKPAHFDWRAWTRRSWPPPAPAGAGTRSPACLRGAPGCRPTWPA